MKSHTHFDILAFVTAQVLVCFLVSISLVPARLEVVGGMILDPLLVLVRRVREGNVSIAHVRL